MKLEAVEISQYRCIRESNRFTVGEITCLVGKNESGKTALLQALYRLNPIVPEHSKFDVTDEYPRADVEEYNQQVENEEIDPAIVVKAEYRLAPEEIKTVETTYGKGVFAKDTFVLSKGYGNELYVEIETDEAAAVQGLVRGYKLPDEVSKGALDGKNFQELKAYLDADGQKRQENHAAARQQADALSDPDAKRKAIHDADILVESEAAKKLKGLLTAILQSNLGIYIWTHHLKSYCPKFLYFDEYYQLEGHLNIEKLREREAQKNLKNSDRPNELLGNHARAAKVRYPYAAAAR
jgi:energy-coupling factor transporter ATP-binding protein EcfA2